MYTAGDHKDAFDPFQPEKPDEIAHLRTIQDDIHASFCAEVRTRRQGKLKGDEAELFSGRFWSGRAALGLGLVDGIGDLRSLMRERFGETVELVVVGERRGWLRRKFGLGHTGHAGEEVAAGLTREVISAVEERLLWSRYGV